MYIHTDVLSSEQFWCLNVANPEYFRDGFPACTAVPCRKDILNIWLALPIPLLLWSGVNTGAGQASPCRLLCCCQCRPQVTVCCSYTPVTCPGLWTVPLDTLSLRMGCLLGLLDHVCGSTEVPVHMACGDTLGCMSTRP